MLYISCSNENSISAKMTLSQDQLSLMHEILNTMQPCHGLIFLCRSVWHAGNEGAMLALYCGHSVCLILASKHVACDISCLNLQDYVFSAGMFQ